jgi:hypothetical protein
MFGRKPTPGVVIYVCCQQCAAKVKSDPGGYLTKVIAERGAGTREATPTAYNGGPTIGR